MLKILFGDKKFYKRVLVLMIPILVQNGIMQFVNMLDNIMVGRVGTVEMTGVAVANQLIFVFNLCIFGAVSGAGIFGAQFFGKNDQEGVRNTFRFKVVSTGLITALAILLFLLCGRSLSQLYLTGEGDAADTAASLQCAVRYLNIMLIGLLPNAIAQCYDSTLREIDRPVVPMVAGLIAVGVNLFLNYVLIFGNLGAPALGVEGAAIATVISRFVELGVIVVWCGLHTGQYEFIKGAYRTLKVPGKLCKEIILRGLPLTLNETLWAAGMALLNQTYSVRSYDVVTANSICQTFYNVFSVSFIAVGSAIGIILGQLLGAGEAKKARESVWRLITFSILCSIVVGTAFFIGAQWVPLAYNTTDEIRLLATRFMEITAVWMPLEAFANATYFTLRSGGKVLVTFLFDSCFVWVVNVPLALALCYLTSLPVLPLYAISMGVTLIKDIIGFVFVKKGIWVKNIVSEEKG